MAYYYLLSGNGGNVTNLDVVTATAGDVRAGKVIVDKNGAPITGTLAQYSGTTAITPSQSTQTFSTNGKILGSNLTVNPISYPSNFAAQYIKKGTTITIGGKSVTGTWEGYVPATGDVYYKGIWMTGVDNTYIRRQFKPLTGSLETIPVTFGEASMLFSNKAYATSTTPINYVLFGLAKSVTSTNVGTVQVTARMTGRTITNPYLTCIVSDVLPGASTNGTNYADPSGTGSYVLYNGVQLETRARFYRQRVTLSYDNWTTCTISTGGGFTGYLYFCFTGNSNNDNYLEIQRIHFS